MWEKHHAVGLILLGTVGLIEDGQNTLKIAIIDFVQPLLTLRVDLGSEAPALDVNAFVSLDVDVAALGHVVAFVADPLVQADLVALGLGVDRGGEGGEQDAQYYRSETCHVRLMLKHCQGQW